MNVERSGILIISVILVIMLAVKYVKRYNPINLFAIPLISFIDAVYVYLTIYNVYLEWYFTIFIYILIILFPLILVLLQYNNIILKRQILYYSMKHLFSIKQYDKTMEYITKLVDLEGRNSEYMYILGKCYKEKGDYINARDSFALAVEMNSKDYLSCYELGLILDETNKKEVARTMFSKALKINQNFYDAAEALGISLTSQGKFEKAVKVYRNMLKKFPESYEIYYNIGMLEMELGNLITAREAFNSCGKINTNLYMAHYNVGKISMSLKEYDIAIDALKKILKSPVYGPKAYYKIATIYSLKKEYEKSIANLEYAIELDEHFIEDARKDDYFNYIKKELNVFLDKKEKDIEKKKQRRNFMYNKFGIFKKAENDNIRLTI